MAWHIVLIMQRKNRAKWNPFKMWGKQMQGM
jgi:hypothetical protein